MPNLCCVLLVVFTSALLILSEQGQAVITTLANPFEGGPVGSCEVPTTTLCEGIDYPVPTSIARLADIIENIIRNRVEEQADQGGNCLNTYKDALCTLWFPRCLGLQEGSQNIYSEVELNNQNCSVLQDACNSTAMPEMICSNLLRTTVPATGCNLVKELVGNFSFNFCNLGGLQDTLVTDWMFEYMKFTDRSAGGILYNDRFCNHDYAMFMCTLGSQCTADESEIIFTNTFEYCNSIENCYGFGHRDLARDELACHLWPEEVNISISVGTSDDSTTQILDGTTDFNSSAQQSATWLAVYVLIAVLLSFHHGQQIY